MLDKIIGNYKITKFIGEGGMATVYEAEHKVLGTNVAIKVLNPILSSNPQIKERFINEARLMASLDHPNITRVIDFDDQPNQLSIVMDLLKGEDLNEIIKRKGALSEQEILSVFSQTLSAFKYAHEKGIVHRDIKPSNIFVLSDGTVKILDFGIAKLFGQGNEMTQTGTQMGTPMYMSPEQVKADKSIDHRSDIYSLGVTLYYALNGKPPYDGNTNSQFDIFNKIVYEPLPELPGNSYLNDLVKKACQKDRELRFQNCEEWLQALKKEVSVENRSTESEKTILSGPSSEKTVLSASSSNKTVVEKASSDKTTIEQNPPIQQARQQEQSNSKLTSQTVNQNNVGSQSSNLAVVSLVVGILALILCWIPAVGIIFGISALVLGILGQKNSTKNLSSNKGLGIAGIIIGSLATLLSLILIVLVVIGISLWGERAQSEMATYNEVEASENVTESEGKHDQEVVESATEAPEEFNSDYYSDDQNNYINPDYMEESANSSMNADEYYDDY
jgi:serine/threonine protein kinase